MNTKENMKKILLVDDEEDIREVLSMALVDMGYHILTADNGKSGWQTYNEERPPIVMTDIKMPVMDGIELLQRIKRHNPETEVIMITGHGDMDLAIKSLKHRASDFITKPINVDALEISLTRTREKILTRRNGAARQSIQPGTHGGIHLTWHQGTPHRPGWRPLSAGCRSGKE